MRSLGHSSSIDANDSDRSEADLPTHGPLLERPGPKNLLLYLPRVGLDKIKFGLSQNPYRQIPSSTSMAAAH